MKLETQIVLKHKAHVAFLDVLGFSKLVSGAHWQEDVLRYLKVVGQAVDEATRKNNPDEHQTSVLKSIIVSDSIILWTVPVQTNGEYRVTERVYSLQYLLKAIALIQYRCACHDIWIRGGVSFGDIIYTDSNIAGRGYLKAYQLETVAEFPRVLVDAEMIRDLFGHLSARSCIASINESEENVLGTGPLYDFTNAGTEGTEFKNDYMFFVHYLENARFLENADDFENIWKHIQYNLYDTLPKIYRKYKWVAEYLWHYNTILGWSKPRADEFDFSQIMSKHPL